MANFFAAIYLIENTENLNMVVYCTEEDEHSKILQGGLKLQEAQNDEERLVKRFFNAQGLLNVWPPAKEKNKILILAYLVSFFEFEKNYTAAEVNSVLLPHLAFPDPGIIRRALHEYCFLQRYRDGSCYWRVDVQLSNEERIKKKKNANGWFYLNNDIFDFRLYIRFLHIKLKKKYI